MPWKKVDANYATIVRAEVVGVDNGRISYTPGVYGVICADQPEKDKKKFPLIHWQDCYTCNAPPGDFSVVREERVGRIIGNSTSCPFCDAHRNNKRRLIRLCKEILKHVKEPCGHTVNECLYMLADRAERILKEIKS